MVLILATTPTTPNHSRLATLLSVCLFSTLTWPHSPVSKPLSVALLYLVCSTPVLGRSIPRPAPCSLVPGLARYMVQHSQSQAVVSPAISLLALVSLSLADILCSQNSVCLCQILLYVAPETIVKPRLP